MIRLGSCITCTRRGVISSISLQCIDCDLTDVRMEAKARVKLVTNPKYKSFFKWLSGNKPLFTEEKYEASL